jgi:choline transport protein
LISSSNSKQESLANHDQKFSLVGYDAAAHLSEEIPNPRIKCPKIMIQSILIGIFTGLIFLVALIFSLKDIQAVITAPEGPILRILIQATGSANAAVALLVFPVTCMLLGTFAVMTTSSRLIYAFARDQGLPFSGWLGTINPTLNVPINSLIVSAMLPAIYGVLYLASPYALNAIISASVVAVNLSYAFPIAVSMANMRRGLPADRPYKMNEFVGWISNFMGVLFTALTTVLFLFPPVKDMQGAKDMSMFSVSFPLVPFHPPYQLWAIFFFFFVGNIQN